MLGFRLDSVQITLGKTTLIPDEQDIHLFCVHLFNTETRLLNYFQQGIFVSFIILKLKHILIDHG